MHIKWNSNWSSIMSSSSFLNSLESPNRSGRPGVLKSINNGLDTVEISQAAIDALKSMKESQPSESTEGGRVKGYARILEDQLDALVSAGTIDSDLETVIKNALIPQDKGTPAHYRRNGALDEILDGLVSDQAISGEQRAAIEEALKPPRGGDADPKAKGLEKQLKDKLDPLVTDGTIDSDQEAAIIDALKPPRSEGAENGAKGLTQKLKDKLDALVTAGTLTTEEEEKIQDALTSHVKKNSNHHHHNGIEKILDRLVDRGTISDEQKEAIEAALKLPADTDAAGEETEA